ncbi:MAG: oxygenase MpaB family protein [Candidatus Nanopelagicales bacterium]
MSLAGSIVSTVLPPAPMPVYGWPDSTSNDPGYFGPGSLTWRIHADPGAAVAGVRAIFMQSLHPQAMAGVARYSDYREDPWRRLGRTAQYIGAISFGTCDEADRVSAAVRSVHARLGVDAADLLAWVHYGFVDSMLSVTRRGGLRLSDEQADRYVAEQVQAAKLIGLSEADVPHDVKGLRDYLTQVRPVLRATAEARDAARFILVPPMDSRVRWFTPAQPLWSGLTTTAFAALPRWARRMFGDGIVGELLGGVPLLSDVSTTVALRSWRRSFAALPTELRKGPYVSAAEKRLDLTVL